MDVQDNQQLDLKAFNSPSKRGEEVDIMKDFMIQQGRELYGIQGKQYPEDHVKPKTINNRYLYST